MNRHEAMFAYMKNYPKISKLFSFNFAEAKNNSSAFRVIDEEVRKTDIFGDETFVYTFAIAEYKNYSTEPYTSENLENLAEVDAFIDWVREQNRANNFPNFGEDCLVDIITAARTGSGIAGIDPMMRLAQYTFTVKVTYEKTNQGG